MSKKLAILVSGFVALSASQVLAGSAGGNTGSSAGIADPVTRYGVCFADGAKVRYFTPVFPYAVGPKTGPNMFSFAFGNFLGTAYPFEGKGLDARCDVENAKAGAEAWKNSTVAASRTQIVQTNWQP